MQPELAGAQSGDSAQSGRPRTPLALIGVYARIPFGFVAVALANRHRNQGHWARAAQLFERAAAAVPMRQDFAIQAGNCHKEAGNHPRAIAWYDSIDHPAHRPEALFQKAQVLIAADDEGAAIAVLHEAAMAHGGAARQLRAMAGEDAAFTGTVAFGASEPFPALKRPIDQTALPQRLAVDLPSRRWLGSLGQDNHAPAKIRGMGGLPHAAITQAGWMRLDTGTFEQVLLLGVVAIRGRVVSARPVQRVELKLGDTVIASPEPVLVRRLPGDQWSYVVNVWVDCDRLAPQRAKLALVAIDDAGQALTAEVVVNVTRAPASLDLTDSDSYVAPPAADYTGPVAAEVLARPAEVRSAERSMFSGPIRHVLVMRVDQLGDISASLPAMQRLRDLFPDARLTGVVSPGLVPIMRATGIFDAVHSLDLVYSHASETRFLEPAEERRISALFAQEAVDMAIDLCVGAETRPLLRLFRARYLIGFDPHKFDFLDFGITTRASDKVNRASILSHAAHVRTLVEALAVALATRQPSVARRTDDRALLGAHGLNAGAYWVIHTGARHAINCWPMAHYLDLAARLDAAFGVPIALFADNPPDAAMRARLPADTRVRLFEKMPFDDFDAIIANAGLFVGNDSGPKHLAAVHGVETVSIHINRMNWREWGQDGAGLIISKRVPCAGCALNDEAQCGMAVACIRTITVDEVFDAIRAHVAQSSPSFQTV